MPEKKPGQISIHYPPGHEGTYFYLPRARWRERPGPRGRRLLAPNEDTLFGIPMELYWLPKQPPAKGAPPAAGPYQLGCLDSGRGHLATHKNHI